MASRAYRILFRIILPWLCTIGALWVVSRGMEWRQFAVCVRGVRPGHLVIPVVLTGLSYLWRTVRWRLLFPREAPALRTAYKGLVFGFFMNNVLPARAGELVRAHVGSKLSGESRSLVLATIAAERLLDGIALSLFLGIGLFGIHGVAYGGQLRVVALAFGAAGVLTLLFLSQRRLVDRVITEIESRVQAPAVGTALSKVRHFIDGLTPLFCPRRLPGILIWTLVVWSLELAVFWWVSLAYGVVLSVYQVLFFLVASNFASLIPAAPGGLGIVEAVSTTILVSLGVDREAAFAMSLTQHVIQYAMVGMPGLYLMIRFRELRAATTTS